MKGFNKDIDNRDEEGGDNVYFIFSFLIIKSSQMFQ